MPGASLRLGPVLRRRRAPDRAFAGGGVPPDNQNA